MCGVPQGSVLGPTKLCPAQYVVKGFLLSCRKERFNSALAAENWFHWQITS